MIMNCKQIFFKSFNLLKTNKQRIAKIKVKHVKEWLCNVHWLAIKLVVDFCVVEIDYTNHDPLHLCDDDLSYISFYNVVFILMRFLS
jgi:hypothetical protein